MAALSSLTRPWVIAHRGQAGEQENTLAAFEWAVQIGADLIEFDLRRSRDGIWVIHHDPDLQGYPLIELTYDQICQLTPLPTLDQALQLLRGRIGLDIELKQPGHESELVEAILSVCDLDQVIVTSFLTAPLRKLRHCCPSLQLGILSGPREPIPVMLNEFDLFLPHWQDLLSPQAPLCLSRDQISLPIVPWTVNHLEQVPSLLEDPQIWGVITDRPESVLALKQSPTPGSDR